MEDTPKLSRLARLKAALAAHHKSTLLGKALTGTAPEDWATMLASEYEAGKKISDFVGMLVRTGFVFLAFVFFLHRAREADTWLLGWALGMCAMFSVYLYLALFWRINGIVAVYFLKDTAGTMSRFHRIVKTVLAMILSSAALFGVSQLAYTVATTSNLVR